MALLKDDFKVINTKQDDHEIQMSHVQTYKENIKSKIKLAAFNHIMETQQSHSKVRNMAN